MGLVPGAGGTVSITARIGRHRAAWLALTGERIDVAHRARLGPRGRDRGERGERTVDSRLVGGDHVLVRGGCGRRARRRVRLRGRRRRHGRGRAPSTSATGRRGAHAPSAASRPTATPPSRPTRSASCAQEWFFATDDAVTATPAVVDGTVYVGDWSGRFYAIDLDSGELDWSFTAEPHAQRLRRADRRVGHGRRRGRRADRVRRRAARRSTPSRADDGEVRWERDLGQPEGDDDPTEIESSPAVVDGLVIVGYRRPQLARRHAGRGGRARRGDRRPPVADDDRADHRRRRDRCRLRRRVGVAHRRPRAPASCSSAPATAPRPRGGATTPRRCWPSTSTTASRVWTYQPHEPNLDDLDFAGAPNLFEIDGRGRRRPRQQGRRLLRGRPRDRRAGVADQGRRARRGRGRRELLVRRVHRPDRRTPTALVVGGTAVGRVPAPARHRRRDRRDPLAAGRGRARPSPPRSRPTASCSWAAPTSRSGPSTSRPARCSGRRRCRERSRAARWWPATTSSPWRASGSPAASSPTATAGVYRFSLGDPDDPATTATTTPATTGSVPTGPVDPAALAQPCVAAPCPLDFTLSAERVGGHDRHRHAPHHGRPVPHRGPRRGPRRPGPAGSGPAARLRPPGPACSRCSCRRAPTTPSAGCVCVLDADGACTRRRDPQPGHHLRPGQHPGRRRARRRSRPSPRASTAWSPPTPSRSRSPPGRLKETRPMTMRPVAAALVGRGPARRRVRRWRRRRRATRRRRAGASDRRGAAPARPSCFSTEGNNLNAYVRRRAVREADDHHQRRRRSRGAWTSTARSASSPTIPTASSPARTRASPTARRAGGSSRSRRPGRRPGGPPGGPARADLPEDDPENYGCGVLSDGRVVTTDIGNQVEGPPSGQLIVWFPPFDERAGAATARSTSRCRRRGGIDVGVDDALYVATARPPDNGIVRVHRPVPHVARRRRAAAAHRRRSARRWPTR